MQPMVEGRKILLTVRRASNRHMCRISAKLPSKLLKSSLVRVSKVPSVSALTLAALVDCKRRAVDFGIVKLTTLSAVFMSAEELHLVEGVIEALSDLLSMLQVSVKLPVLGGQVHQSRNLC